MLLTLPLSSRGKKKDSRALTAASLFATDATARRWEIWREI